MVLDRYTSCLRPPSKFPFPSYLLVAICPWEDGPSQGSWEAPLILLDSSPVWDSRAPDWNYVAICIFPAPKMEPGSSTRHYKWARDSVLIFNHLLFLFLSKIILLFYCSSLSAKCWPFSPRKKARILHLEHETPSSLHSLFFPTILFLSYYLCLYLVL